MKQFANAAMNTMGQNMSQNMGPNMSPNMSQPPPQRQTMPNMGFVPNMGRGFNPNVNMNRREMNSPVGVDDIIADINKDNLSESSEDSIRNINIQENEKRGKSLNI